MTAIVQWYFFTEFKSRSAQTRTYGIATAAADSYWRQEAGTFAAAGKKGTHLFVVIRLF